MIENFYMGGKGVTYTTTEQAGIKIYIGQYQPTGRPIEDYFSITTDESSKRLIIGIYDGHGGAATADYISNILPAALLHRPPSDHAQIFKSTDDMMMYTFTNDHGLLRSKSQNWVEHAEVVKSGCTALIFDIDITTMVASFANAGDCRAVVCGTSGTSNHRLRQTEDLNARTPSEQERLKREHPGEDLLIVSGRLFGRLMTTRGFGDACYKLPNGIIGNWQHRKYIDILSSIEKKGKVPMNAQYQALFTGYRTPPYLTATPEVGKMQLQQNDIVIIASDGLWDCISSEEAVRIACQGIDQKTTDPAKYLLDAVKAIKPPVDDVTLIIFQV